MRSSIRIWPSSWEMSDKHWVMLFGSHCFRGMAKTRIAGFVGLRCSFRAIGTSASVEQRLREFMPLCLDSNTRGHVLLSRLPQRRACMFWLGSSHQEPLNAGVSRNLATVVVRGVLPWLRKRRTGLLSSGPKSSFQMRTSFVFNLETKALESGEAHSPSCLKSSVKFPQSDDLGYNVICWCWSTVFFENQCHCTRLPRHFGALHASFCWPAF